MAANGISTSTPLSNRANLKLSLSQTIRSTLPATVADNSVVWTEEIYNPSTYNPPQPVTYWYPSSTVTLNTYINVNGIFYKCTTAGTTGAIAPTWVHYFGYRPLNVINQAEVNPPRPIPLATGRPWIL